MAELKTKPTKASVAKFIAAISDDDVRRDCKTIASILRRATGKKPEMWGTSIVGFGRYRYQGRTSSGEWMQTGFSPRKTAITVYVMSGFKDQAALLRKLGKHTHSVGCLYIKRLSDVHVPTLERIVRSSVAKVRETDRKNRS